MVPDAAQLYYRAHGSLTDPGPHAAAVDALPGGIEALAAVVRNLLIHDAWLHLYGLSSDDLPDRSRATQPIARRLAVVLAAGPLALERSPAARAVGTCRDYALMLCAFLRQHAVPARVRCGFARYFGASRYEDRRYEDHWVCEYWRAGERRWVLADAQLDAAHRAHLGIGFDSLALPRDQFLTAGAAWRLVRSGRAEADGFGHGTACGEWFLRVNLARDLLALGKREVSDWDTWREVPVASRPLDADARAWCDAVAALTADVDTSLPAIQSPPVEWGRQLRPFWRP